MQDTYRIVHMPWMAWSWRLQRNGYTIKVFKKKSEAEHYLKELTRATTLPSR